MWLYNHIHGNDRIVPQYHSYFGAKFSDEEVIKFCEENGIKYTKYSDEELNKVVTDCLIDAGVVGWFQGRAEFGPRALGHRSILADPTRDDAKISAEIAESNLDLIKHNKKVTVTIPSLNIETIGKISAIIPSSNPMTHTFKIKVSFKTKNTSVYPGMYATVGIKVN